MSKDQLVFSAMFQNQTYGPRNSFEPHDWQIECSLAYQEHLSSWRDAHKGNGAPGQHRFTIYGGTGIGKTKAVGIIASSMLNDKMVGQVVVVVPNRSIRHKARRDFREFFGIDLVIFHAKKYADGIPRTKQGYILTYAHLMNDPTLHRRICSPPERTLVIFDEVHHLGDGNGWGDSAKEAFGLVPHVVNLSGTPWRSDDVRIPFVTYEDTARDGIVRFKADYHYPLGRAVADAICRKPLFCFANAEVRVRFNPDSDEFTVSFDDVVNDAVKRLRLRGAVNFGSTDRFRMLKEALGICRKEGRKVIVFLGGDTDGEQTPTVNATEMLPLELQEMGIGPDEYEVVTGDDADAQAKIDQFGKSSKWILVSINMVSEGTDIPELSAAIFLTSITAKQTTVQRIGRVLRLMGRDDPHETALIFMFRDPDYVILADEIEAEIRHEIDLKKKRRDPSKDTDGPADPRHCRAESIGVGDGELAMVKFHGRSWPFDVFEAKQRELRERGLPPTMLNAALSLLMGGE